MEENNHINIDDEYKKLGHKGNTCGMRKINSERKLTSGILKHKKSRKQSHFIQKEKIENTSGIKWDDKSIEKQKDYRKNHPVDKEKFKNSIAKYASSVIDKDDIYVKELNKVNEMNANDEIISIIFNLINDSNTKNINLKRNKSCLTIGKHKKALSLQDLYDMTEKEKIFDDSLGEEQKLTLINTLYNKIKKEVKDE